MSASIYGRLPSIPEYYKDFIDSSVDLLQNPKQCCPFHQEDTPSFSYSDEKGKWRCFGSCHCGGDVVDLHRKNYHMMTRKQAEDSLCELYKVDKSLIIRDNNSYLDFVNEDRIHSKTLYNLCILKANTVERWLQLDYVMSKFPVNDEDLQDLLRTWDKKGEMDYE